MQYLKFKETIQDSPLFSSSQLNVLEKNEQILRNQLNRWVKKGLVLKLRKGLYILNGRDRKINPSQPFLANQIYSPSYVSLEYALAFYELIPEEVPDVTSVSTRKTAHFQNDFGAFHYQHIPVNAYHGFQLLTEKNGLGYFIALPEKAVVDFLYFNLSSFNNQNTEIFNLSYRFQNLSTLKKDRVIEFAEIFQTKKLLKVARLFCDFARKEK